LRCPAADQVQEQRLLPKTHAADARHASAFLPLQSALSTHIAICCSITNVSTCSPCIRAGVLQAGQLGDWMCAVQEWRMGRDSRGRAQEAQWKLMLQGSQVGHSPASRDCGLGAMHVSLCSTPLFIVPIGVHAELECLNGMFAAASCAGISVARMASCSGCMPLCETTAFIV